MDFLEVQFVENMMLKYFMDKVFKIFFHCWPKGFEAKFVLKLVSTLQAQKYLQKCVMLVNKMFFILSSKLYCLT